MSQVYKNGILYANDEPVIHEGSTGYAEMVQYSWVWVGDKRIIQPFVSRVYAKDLKNLSSKLTVNGFKVATMDSYFEKSYGDELSDGGVISGTKGGKAHFTTGSPTVTVDGVPVVRRGDLIICNNGNSQVGPWQEQVPGAPSFDEKLTSTPLNETHPIQTLKIAIGVNPREGSPENPAVLPFERALLAVSTDGAKRYQHTAGVAAKNGFITYQLDVNESEIFDIKECLNDPMGGVYEVHQGRAKISSNNTPGDIAMVAMDFKIFRTAAHDTRYISTKHLGSWMYLFKDGKLWREFQHWQRYKNVCEVNLEKHAGKDTRPTSMRIGRGILLTIQDKEGAHTYGYVVSPVQWDWATLERMNQPEAQAKRVQKIYPEKLFTNEKTIETVNYTCPSGVAWAVYPPEATPDKMHPQEAPFQHPHPALGVMYLKDPLGNALIEAKQISKRYNEHLGFLAENKDLYQSGILVGSVLDAFEQQGKNYREHVREEERVKHAAMYEAVLEQYEQDMQTSVPRLKAHLEQAMGMNAWEDFGEPLLGRAAEYWAYLGFGLNQTKAGREYFGTLLMDEKSALNETMEKLKSVARDQTWRTIILDLADQCIVAAAHMDGGPEKMTKWVNEVVPDLPRLDVVEVPLLSLMSEEKKKSSSLELVPHTSVYQFKSAGIECLVRDSGSSRRNFEEAVSMETLNRLDDRHARLGNAMVKVVQWNGQHIQRVAFSITQGPTVARAFSALTVMNAAHIYKQIDDKKYDILSSEWLWLHGELYVSVAELFTYLPKVMGKNIYQLMEHKWGSLIKPEGVASKGIKALGAFSEILGFGLNIKGAREAFESGEVGLFSGYFIGIQSNVVQGFLYFANLSRFARFAPVGPFMLLSVVATIISFCMIMYYTKKQWESWLFSSPWGKSDSRTECYEEHFEALLEILQMVYLSDIKYAEYKLKSLIPAREAIFDEIGRVIFERPQSPILHEQLMGSPVILSFKLQQLEGGIFTTQLSSYQGSHDAAKPIVGAYYQKIAVNREGIQDFDLVIPANYLPSNGSGLLLKIEYYLSTPGKEQIPLLESYLYEIEYDRREYQYHAKLISQKKNTQADLYAT